MAMYVKTEYDGFVAKVLITSDTVGEIDLLSKEFRIDIADQMKAFYYASDLMNDLGTINNNDPEDAVTDEEKADAEAEVNDIMNDISTPIVSVDSSNYREYCNSDDESLWRNGFQFWVSYDKKSMSMRFIPKNTADMESKLKVYRPHGWGKTLPKDGTTPSWCSLIVCVAFDYKNTTKFDVCLMPRLITGPVVLKEDNVTDPVIPEASARPDYPFNGELDKDYLYLNNADGFSGDAQDKTPVFLVKSSAFITEDVGSAVAGDPTTLFDWTRFKSDLFDGAAQTGIPLPYDINGVTDTSAIPIPSESTVEVLPGHSLQGVYMYEITQTVEASAMSGQDPITFAKNKVRLSVAI